MRSPGPLLRPGRPLDGGQRLPVVQLPGRPGALPGLHVPGDLRQPAPRARRVLPGLRRAVGGDPGPDVPVAGELHAPVHARLRAGRGGLLRVPVPQGSRLHPGVPRRLRPGRRRQRAVRVPLPRGRDLQQAVHARLPQGPRGLQPLRLL
ncbi:hypothetical protein FOCC_FOCC005081, partial [Frankliniella occidentalis]